MATNPRRRNRMFVRLCGCPLVAIVTMDFEAIIITIMIGCLATKYMVSFGTEIGYRSLCRR